MKGNSIRKMVYAALCLALGLLLPFFSLQIPEIASKMSPMHIPVLLCGFVCGWKWGLLVGFVTPLLRSVLFHMPAMMPNAVGMAFELAAYGCASGILYALLPKKTVYVYVSLIGAMLIGRMVYGAASYFLFKALGNSFTWELFVANAFINAVPGIILHIAIIPPIVLALEKAGIIKKEG